MNQSIPPLIFLGIEAHTQTTHIKEIKERMPIKTNTYAAPSATEPLGPWTIERRDPGDHDVLIEIQYCGVCHSDVHQARDEWGGSLFPMVPGHEIVGLVSKIGSQVTKFRVGDRVGVGCMVDSCRTCEACVSGIEQHCEKGNIGTYNSHERDGVTRTYGGYSTRITVDESFVLRVPDNLSLDRVAPLLCAGITTYSPLSRFGVKKGHHVAVAGLGGLGHMAVKIAKAMGAKVTVLSRSHNKRESALALGADELVTMEENNSKFDFIIDTISAKHDYNTYLSMLRLDGTLCLLGAPPPSEVHAFSLIGGRRNLTGSLIGGIAETQEMLDFCGKHNIMSDIEVIPMDKINESYERMIKGDVMYRFVIDIASLKSTEDQ